jgi:ferredoxin-NADP reductase
VAEIRPETPTAKTFRLELAQPMEYLAGQHVVLRLSAPDGYTASRSYSLASGPDGSSSIELTVERLPDGEVSSFLHDVVVPGDRLEVRGPIGGYFAWRGDTPVVLVGGGSGVVPLMAMLRLARRLGDPALATLVVSVRQPASLYYPDELHGPDATVLYTRSAPEGWLRPPGRLTAADLPASVTTAETVFVCGTAAFCDTVTGALEQVGVAPGHIRVERFGPTS